MRHTILAFTTVILLLTGCAEDDRPSEPTGSATDTTRINLVGDFQGPLGLQLYSVRHAMEDDVSGTLDWVRDQGFEEVELHSTYGMTPEAFREELDRVGIDATAMHVGYETLEDSLDAQLDRAEALGVEYVGVAWIPHDESVPFSVDLAREAAANFNAWGEAAAERGMQFFYHVHGYEFEPADDGTVPFAVLMEETDPALVTYEMDVFWVAHPGENPAELLRAYPDRWKLMHIKDLREGVTGDYSGHAPAETNVPVGTGQIDYPEVLAAAADVGVEQYYIEDESTEPMNSIPVSVQFLEEVTFPQN